MAVTRSRKREKLNETCTNEEDNDIKHEIAKKSKNGNRCNEMELKVLKKSINDECKPKDIELSERKNQELTCFGYDDEIGYINKIIGNLLKTSEAGSLIVCGDAGIGKTKLIETCLSSFSVLLGQIDDFDDFGHLKVALFRFDGALHGKDDITTIRLIGRRLNQFLDQQQQDKDLEDNEDDDSDRYKFNVERSEKVNSSIPKIMSQFRNLTENYPNFRSIIVLDNFEIFCRKQQTLLYNLLDLTQHGRSILVIGITRRLDYLELLEKRVRSRLTQRIVHLISPFKDLNSYKNYCFSRIKLLCQENPDLEQNFAANHVLIENELAKSFAINRNFDEINRIILENSFFMTSDKSGKMNNLNIYDEAKFKSNSITTIVDPKILVLSQLKKNDLMLIMILLRHLRNQDLKIFTCAQLYQWSIGVSLLRKTRMGLIIKSIYNLMESDLIIYESECCRRKTIKNNVCINKWTKLVPNISEHHLDQFMKDFEHKLPQNLKRLL